MKTQNRRRRRWLQPLFSGEGLGGLEDLTEHTFVGSNPGLKHKVPNISSCFYTNQSGLQGSERGRASLEGLEKLADLEIEGGVVATIAVKGVLGANGAAFKEHPGGIGVRERRLGRRDFRRMG
nr:hypothetical protein Itr_chr12CG10580 [Ipomoea trifida]